MESTDTAVSAHRHVHGQGWTTVAFTEPGGNLLTSGADGDVCCIDWTAKPRKQERRMNISSSARAVVAGNSRFFVASEELQVNACMIEDGSLDYEIFKFSAEVTCIALQRQLLVAGAADFQIRCAELEDGCSDIGESFVLTGHTAPVLSACIDPTCHYIASSACDGTVRLWDVSTRKQIAVKPGLFARHSDIDEKEPLVALDFHPVTGELAVPTLKELHIYSVGVLGQPIHTISVPTERTASGVRFSPNDGKMLFVFDNNDSIFLFFTTSRVCFKTLRFGAPIISAAWNHNATAVAAADYDGNVAVYDESMFACSDPMASSREKPTAAAGTSGLTQFFVETQIDSQTDSETQKSKALCTADGSSAASVSESVATKVMGRGKNGKWTHADDEMLNKGVEELFDDLDKEFGGDNDGDKQKEKKFKRLKNNALGLESSKKPISSEAFVSARASKKPFKSVDDDADEIADEDDDDADARERDYEKFNESGVRGLGATAEVTTSISKSLERKVSDSSTTSTESKSTATKLPSGALTAFGGGAHKMHVVAAELPKLQAPFQPGSTPAYQSQRFMKWNALGTVTSFYTDEEKSIHIRYHDVSHMPTQKYNNNDKFFKLADLGEYYVALGSECIEDVDDGTDADMKADDDDDADVGRPRRKITPACLRVCSMRRTDEKKQWEFTMPNNENIEGLCCGAGWIACVTSMRFLRIFSEGGMQRAVISLPYPFLCMNGCAHNLLIVMHASPPHADGEPNLVFSMYSIVEATISCTLQSEHVAVSPHSQLYWAGFTDECSPASVDTEGWVRVYKASLTGQPSKQWLPVLNTKASLRKVDHYFVVGVSESHREVRAIFCRGSKYPTAVPRPEVAALKLQLPLCTVGGAVDGDVAAVAAIEADMLFNYLFPGAAFAGTAGATQSQADGTQNNNNVWTLRNEKVQTQHVLKFVAAACQAHRPQRALDAALTITDPGLVEQVCRFVAKMGQTQLTKALTDRAEVLFEEKMSGKTPTPLSPGNILPPNTRISQQQQQQQVHKQNSTVGLHAAAAGRSGNNFAQRQPVAQQNAVSRPAATSAAVPHQVQSRGNPFAKKLPQQFAPQQTTVINNKTTAAFMDDDDDDDVIADSQPSTPTITAAQRRSGTQDVLVGGTTPLKSRKLLEQDDANRKRAKFP